jgi:hypothetical protein
VLSDNEILLVAAPTGEDVDYVPDKDEDDSSGEEDDDEMGNDEEEEAEEEAYEFSAQQNSKVCVVNSKCSVVPRTCFEVKFTAVGIHLIEAIRFA